MSSFASSDKHYYPAAASAAEDPTKSYKGFKFIFAINASTKPGENIWSVPNRRFMLSEYQTAKLFGQYITSNWYSKQYSKGTCIRFAVLMVQNDCAILKICSDDKSILNKTYEGFIFDKIVRNDLLYQYMVYLPELKMVNRFTSRHDRQNQSSNQFKLYIFTDESTLKQKIRVELLEQ